MEKESSYFDDAAYTWDDKPHRIDIARSVAEAIRREIPVTSGMDAMDYGCGTGLVSLAMLPHLRSLHGVDTSDGMLDIFRDKIEKLSLRNCSVEKRNLDREALDPDRFDLIFSSMTFHHIQDPHPVLVHFLESLHPGGWVAVVDLDSEEGDFHDRPDAGVVHYGFDRNWIREELMRAGFLDVRLNTAHVIRKQKTGKEYPLFIAVGRKPA